MAGLVPTIHLFVSKKQSSRGCPRQARHDDSIKLHPVPVHLLCDVLFDDDDDVLFDDDEGDVVVVVLLDTEEEPLLFGESTL
jgi:hypothetical protein